MKQNVKQYSEVQIGDIAYEHPDMGGMQELGKIIWIGTSKELMKSKYKNLTNGWELDDVEVDLKDYDLVVVDMKGDDGGLVLFNYDNDPCGVVVFKPTEIYTLKDIRDAWYAGNNNNEYKGAGAGWGKYKKKVLGL